VKGATSWIEACLGLAAIGCRAVDDSGQLHPAFRHARNSCSTEGAARLRLVCPVINMGPEYRVRWCQDSISSAPASAGRSRGAAVLVDQSTKDVDAFDAASGAEPGSYRGRRGDWNVEVGAAVGTLLRGSARAGG
jgi:hypothetical protein